MADDPRHDGIIGESGAVAGASNPGPAAMPAMTPAAAHLPAASAAPAAPAATAAYPPYPGSWPSASVNPWQSPVPWTPYPTPGWPVPSNQWGGVPTPYPPGPEPGLKWGGVGVRLGALSIDAVIVVVSYFAVAIAASASSDGSLSSRDPSPVTTAAILGWLFFAMAYHPVCWYVFGGTPGQKILGLRIARASSGESLGVSAVLVRYVIFAFVTVAIPIGIICAVMTSQDPFKRAWHDEVARSVVVKRGY